MGIWEIVVGAFVLLFSVFSARHIRSGSFSVPVPDDWPQAKARFFRRMNGRSHGREKSPADRSAQRYIVRTWVHPTAPAGRKRRRGRENPGKETYTDLPFRSESEQKFYRHSPSREDRAHGMIRFLSFHNELLPQAVMLLTKAAFTSPK